jgi:hypothetical protein
METGMNVAGRDTEDTAARETMTTTAQAGMTMKTGFTMTVDIRVICMHAMIAQADVMTIGSIIMTGIITEDTTVEDMEATTGMKMIVA